MTNKRVLFITLLYLLPHFITFLYLLPHFIYYLTSFITLLYLLPHFPFAFHEMLFADILFRYGVFSLLCYTRGRTE